MVPGRNKLLERGNITRLLVTTLLPVAIQRKWSNCSTVGYSQHFRLCEMAQKREIDTKDHRWPKNFDANMSLKSMEPLDAVQHCVDIAWTGVNVYVAGLVTDDDSTTHSNVKHSLSEIVKHNHPGSVNAEEGKILGHMKRKLGWPVDSNNKLLNDTGKHLLIFLNQEDLCLIPNIKLCCVSNVFLSANQIKKRKTMMG